MENYDINSALLDLEQLFYGDSSSRLTYRAEYERLKAYIARDPVLGECEECGQAVVTPLKRFHWLSEQRDALRYRWLRQAVDQDWNKLMHDGGEHLDAAIDQAISLDAPLLPNA